MVAVLSVWEIMIVTRILRNVLFWGSISLQVFAEKSFEPTWAKRNSIVPVEGENKRYQSARVLFKKMTILITDEIKIAFLK